MEGGTYKELGGKSHDTEQQHSPGKEIKLLHLVISRCINYSGTEREAWECQPGWVRGRISGVRGRWEGTVAPWGPLAVSPRGEGHSEEPVAPPSSKER